MTYNTVMVALQQGGQWQESLRLLDQMFEQGGKPDSSTFTAVIGACVSSQQWKRALKVLHRMEKHCPARESRRSGRTKHGASPGEDNAREIPRTSGNDADE